MTTITNPAENGLLREGDVVSGRFLVTQVLGEGGQGQVVLAINQLTQVQFALKIMSAAAHADPKQRNRMFTEASATSKVASDVFVKIFDMIDHNGLPVLVCEYVPGHTLSHEIKLRGPMTMSRAAKIARQVALGLNQAQRKGFIHRDIKPDNIMVTIEDHAKVLDFGIAKNLNDTDGMKTQEGLAFGTPAFMSPQQARGEQLDGRSDIYSLGAVLFSMVTGRLPFVCNTAMEFVIAHITETPPLASSVNPDVPATFADLIARCLKKDPAERFQTGQELADALARFETSRLVPDETRGTAATTKREVPPTGRRTQAIEEGVVPVEVAEADERTVKQEDQKILPVSTPPPRKSKAMLVVAVSVVTAGSLAAILLTSTGRRTSPPEMPVPPPHASEGPKPVKVDPPVTEAARLFLETSPASAEVLVDGVRRTGASPLVIEGPPGKALEVKVSAPGFTAQTFQVTMGGDQRRNITLVEAQMAAANSGPAESARGKIDILVEPSATVFLDGKKIGKTPIRNLSVPAGAHRVRLVNEERGFPSTAPFEKKLNVRAGRLDTIDLDWR